MSNLPPHATAQKYIPRRTSTLFAKADYFVSTALMSPMIAMLISACWWAIMNPKVLARKTIVPGTSYDDYLWLRGFAAVAFLFLLGVALRLPAWFRRRVDHVADAANDPPEHLYWHLANRMAALLVAPPILTLLALLLWTCLNAFQSNQLGTTMRPLRFQELKWFVGPAFCLGCLILLASRISLVASAIRNAPTGPMQTSAYFPATARIGAVIGSLFALPALALIIVVCWDNLLGKATGAQPRAGLSGISIAMTRMIVTLGPSTLVGLAFLLWSGDQWLQYCCRTFQRTSWSNYRKKIKLDLAFFAQLDAIVGLALMSPALVILVISAWTAISGRFGRFPTPGLRRLLMVDISFLGPCIVTGSLLLLVSLVAWSYTRRTVPKSSMETNQLSRIPRLVKIGAIFGTMFISPIPAMLLVIGWECLRQNFYFETHLSKVDSPAVYILEDASDIFGSVVAGGLTFLSLSAVGLCIAWCTQSMHKKPIVHVARSFDDL